MKVVSVLSQPEMASTTQEPEKNSQPKKARRPRRKKFHCFSLYFIGLIIYTAFGGLIFWLIEYNDSKKIAEEHKNRCRDLTSKLTSNFIENLHKTNDSKTLENEFTRSIEELDTCLRNQTTATPEVFDYLRATVYSVTVYTTVGYGYLVTHTWLGQCVTMIYGFIGIPLYIAFISDVGDFIGMKFVHFLKCFRNLCCRLIKRRKLSAEEKETHLSALLRFFFITLFLCIFMILISIIIQHTETALSDNSWQFMESLHFVYSTISLIGFGDSIASHEFYLLLYLPLFIIGQALCALSFYFIQRWIRYDVPRWLTFKCFHPTRPNDLNNANKSSNRSTASQISTITSTVGLGAGKLEHLSPCVPHEDEDNSDTRTIFAATKNSTEDMKRDNKATINENRYNIDNNKNA